MGAVRRISLEWVSQAAAPHEEVVVKVLAIVPFVLTLGLSVAGLSPAQNQSASDPPEKGFVPLFNGKNLTGWEGDPELWSVRDGVIVGKHPQNQVTNRYLRTKQNFGNFILRVSWKLVEPKGNSGVQIRGELQPNLLVAGFQVEIANPNYGGVYEELGRGWIKQPGPEVKKAIKPDAWNQYEIRAQGDQVTVTVNGVKAVDFRDDKGRKSGIIALQHYQGEIHFKDILLKPLSK
jgi:hypothetical protein